MASELQVSNREQVHLEDSAAMASSLSLLQGH